MTILSVHRITRQGLRGKLLVQEVEPAETRLDVGVGAAQTVEEANRTLVAGLTAAQGM